MTEYTDQQFIDAIRKAVEIRGEDYVYPSKEEHPEYWGNPYFDNTAISHNLVCRYQLDDGTPACIVGLALSLIDPGLVPASNITSAAAKVLRTKGFSKSIQSSADAAQCVQDGGGDWGEALKSFTSEYAYRTAKR